MSVDFKNVKKAYFLGIGGIGVSAVARMFMHEEKEVFGSDTAKSEITDELEKSGAKIFIGQDINNISDDIDLVIYTIAIEKYAPEFLAAVREKLGGDKVISYPEALSVISKDKYTIAVCGTHGKTTTTAMVAKILMDAGFDPTVIVGSIMADAHSNFVAGKSRYLVVEACEYCRSFLNINPTIVGITTIDADHLDYYRDEEDILSAFKEFAGKGELVVGDLSDKKISEVASGKIHINSLDFFDPNMELRVPGEHNRRNASVALAIADFLLIDKKSAIASLENFSGTWRRFEYKGKTKNGAMVYDDYAHHPREIAATLKGAQEKFPDKKIVAVFQPHLYSRTKSFFVDFALELSKANRVLVLPIYKAREQNDPTISSEMLVEEIKKKNHSSDFSAFFAKDFEEAKNSLLDLDDSFVILIMGAGDIGELPKILI